MIKSTSYSQEEIIKNILNLHLPGATTVDCDPTYSRGHFYKNIPRPVHISDLEPYSEMVTKADCRKLPFNDNSIGSIMFDPPFVVSKGPSLKQSVKGQNVIHNRFSSFGSPKELWQFYEDSLIEFFRVLKENGILIFKCQDTVSGGKQYLSSHFIVAKAAEIGYYPKDVFVLLAKNRLISGKVKKQQHARKFHSYFLVLEKRTKRKGVTYATIP